MAWKMQNEKKKIIKSIPQFGHPSSKRPSTQHSPFGVIQHECRSYVRAYGASVTRLCANESNARVFAVCHRIQSLVRQLVLVVIYSSIVRSSAAFADTTNLGCDSMVFKLNIFELWSELWKKENILELILCSLNARNRVEKEIKSDWQNYIKSWIITVQRRSVLKTERINTEAKPERDKLNEKKKW